MLEFTVIGMDCQHCVESVTTAVSAVPGAAAVAVDLHSGQVRIDGAPDPAAVRAAIERAGYDVAA
jgi:copper chaperone CopZ